MKSKQCKVIDYKNYKNNVEIDENMKEIICENKSWGLESERWVWVTHATRDLVTTSKVAESSLIILVVGDHPFSENKIKIPKSFISRIKKKQGVIVIGGTAIERAEIVGGYVDIGKYLGWAPIMSSEIMKNNAVEIREFYAELAKILNTKSLDKATLMRMSYEYLKNVFINAPIIDPVVDISNFEDCASGRPVLIVAAGPSLNKQLDTLKRHRNLFLVLAVDTTWPILQKQGITPDFVFAIDPASYANWSADEFKDETALIVDAGCGPKVVWSTNKNHIWNSGNPQCLMLMSRLGVDLKFLPTGGSVATTAFVFARHIGGAPIVLIGQDLALTGGKDHADGYKESYTESHLRNRAEMGFDVPGYDGGVVRTERQLMYYKTWYEKTIKENPELVVINSTEGGAKIHGALQIPFLQVCEELQKYNIKRGFSFLSLPTVCKKTHMRKITENLAEIIEDVKDYREISLRGAALIEKSKMNLSRKVFKDIDELNKKLLEFDAVARMLVDMFAAFNIHRIGSEAKNKDLNPSFEKAAEKYLAIFLEVERSCGNCLTLLNRVQRFYSELDCDDPFASSLVDEILADDIMNYKLL